MARVGFAYCRPIGVSGWQVNSLARVSAQLFSALCVYAYYVFGCAIRDYLYFVCMYRPCFPVTFRDLFQQTLKLFRAGLVPSRGLLYSMFLRLGTTHIYSVD